MSGELLPALGFGQIAPHAGGECCLLDETRDLLGSEQGLFKILR